MILLLENDYQLQKELQKMLLSVDTEVVAVSNIADGFTELEKHTPDVVILDRVLADGDGLELLEYIVDSELSSRVLVLTQKNELRDRIDGLEKGADDYLPKPFSRVELVLKTKVLHARRKVYSDELLHLGPVSFSPTTGQLHIGSTIKTIRKRESEILACLVRYKNQVLSRDRIISQVWGASSEQPNYATLDVYMRRLRMALAGHADLLETIRGFGYRAIER